MELSQLEVFLAVARERRFSRAAEKLFRTQSAVSQTIRKLEDELGEALFDRSSREGVLTDAGKSSLRIRRKADQSPQRGHGIADRTPRTAKRQAGHCRQRIHCALSAAGLGRIPPPASHDQDHRRARARQPHPRRRLALQRRIRRALLRTAGTEPALRRRLSRRTRIRRAAEASAGFGAGKSASANSAPNLSSRTSSTRPTAKK